MDQNRIDRLFREKLEHLQVKPSSESWGAVEKQIQPRNTGTAWYWLAASIVLLFTSWMVWPGEQSNPGTPILSAVSQPTAEPQPELILPELRDSKQMLAKTPVRKVDTRPSIPMGQAVAQGAVRKTAGNSTKEDIQLETINLKSAIAIAEVETPEIEEVKESTEGQFEYQPVKITYIASSSREQVIPTDDAVADSTGVLKKFIAFTEKIDPGEMLADIKTAKDNLFSSGFKSKKDKNSL